MSDSDNYLKLLEKMSDLRESVGVIQNEMKHLQQNYSDVKKELQGIQTQDIKQNDLLAEHILGVQTSMSRLEIEIRTRQEEKDLREKQLKEIEVRLKNVEFVPNLIDHMKVAIVWIGAIATAIAALGKLFGHL